MGPAAAIVLGREPTDLDRENTENLLQSLGDVRTDSGSLAVSIRSTRTIAGTYEGEERSFWFDWQIDDHEDPPGWRRQIEETFRLRPKGRLSVTAGMNRPADHRVLGEVVLQLALLLEGVIDFDGALLPLASPAWTHRMSWPEVSSSVRQLLKDLPGRVIALEYEVNDQRTWACHVGDSQFLKGWLNHPDFHMIK
jgi:Family of unknown function (DUF6368)